MRKAVDLSNYTTNVPIGPIGGAIPAGGKITDAHCQQLMNVHGITHAIIGTQWPLVAEHQLEVCSRNGMTLDLYSWLSWGRDIPSYMRAREYLTQGYLLEHHWVDAEESASGYLPNFINMKIQQGLDGVVNARPGVYTGAWWWGSTGNTTEFSDYDLWLANYTYPAEPDFSSFRKFGGWDKVTLWQYGGSVQLAGMNLDLNIGEPLTVPPSEEHDLTLNFMEGLDGLIRVGSYLILYNSGVPIIRYGGHTPGTIAKNFGGKWIFQRNDGQGHTYWSDEEGD